jgi:hypothetical protein
MVQVKNLMVELTYINLKKQTSGARRVRLGIVENLQSISYLRKIGNHVISTAHYRTFELEHVRLKRENSNISTSSCSYS